MTVREIVTGKLLSCISMAVLLVVTSIPILAVTSMYGGMQLGLLYQSAAMWDFLFCLPEVSVFFVPAVSKRQLMLLYRLMVC